MLIEDERKTVERHGLLLNKVMQCLISESNDAVTEGLLHVRDIYRSLRDDKDFDTGPSLQEIADMLSFLSSPLIACVGKQKDYYFAIGSLQDVADKFSFFAHSCAI